MFLCATVTAIPVFTSLWDVFDCVHRPAPLGYTLAMAPDVPCWRDHHLALAVFSIFLGALYFYLLIPHALVGGNTNHVQYNALFQPRSWPFNAFRYTTLVYKGFAHPYKQHAFAHSVLDLCVRITLPFLVVIFNAVPVLQVTLLTLVGIVHFLAPIIWLPYVDPGFNSLVQGMRFVTLLAMCCGTITVVDGGKYKTLATSLLLSSISMAMLGTIYRMCAGKVKVSPDESLIYCKLAVPMELSKESPADSSWLRQRSWTRSLAQTLRF